MLAGCFAERTTHTGSGAERLLKAGAVAISLLALSACATIESTVSEPSVSLRNLSIESIDMDKQTFRPARQSRNWLRRSRSDVRPALRRS